MADPTFPKRDPAEREFWELRYAASFSPWDAGKVPRQLLSFVKPSPPQRVLVPGCGSAWDVRCFAEHGWSVLGIDFSLLAVEEARAVLGPHAPLVRKADFFAPIEGAPFDVVYERAFLCALPRKTAMESSTGWSSMRSKAGMRSASSSSWPRIGKGGPRSPASK